MSEIAEFFSFGEEPIPYEDAAEIVWSLVKGCDTVSPGCEYKCVDGFNGGPKQWELQSVGPPWTGVCVPPDGSCGCYCSPPGPTSFTPIGFIVYAPCCCLVKGTKVTLTNGRMKNIEDITYEDSLRVWNFDDRKMDSSKPLWIKKPEFTEKYILLEFSNGSHVKTVSQHRIFNKQKGKFTYPMTDDTPLGTVSFTSYGEEVRLISKKYVFEKVEYFNIITKWHINHFANNILTSCRYSNLYPIENMEYVKEPRSLLKKSQIAVPDEYFYEMRLDEQPFPISEMEEYIARLELLKV